MVAIKSLPNLGVEKSDERILSGEEERRSNYLEYFVSIFGDDSRWIDW